MGPKITVRELKEWLDNCDPESQVEFFYYDTISDIPKSPICKFHLCRYAHYKNAKILKLNFSFKEDVTNS